MPQWKALVLGLAGLLSQVGRVSSQDPGAFDPTTANIPPMLRFECSQLVVERLDPLVNPGSVPSPHVHQIVGGDSFNASMDPNTHDLVAKSGCTSCTFSEDFSNYWTAVLYFRARNGTYRRVPQKPSEGLKGNGGITVYYIPPQGTNKTTAFKPGFRMLVGDASLRGPAQKGKVDPKVCHRVTLPKKFCVGGIRSVITFPTCWDGVNLDSADHKSHVAYPVAGSITDQFDYDGGACPESHPVRIPQVMYEVIWDTTPFNDADLWPEDKSQQPFVWSTGDDFGWKGDALQRAMDNRCLGDVCKSLETQTPEKAAECVKSRTVEENIDGWLTELPGMPKK
ncbi:hypothetical protein GQ53DRAFT_764543 [Thozetella sp. PMI_491]|nr:hypothetical protein GQ53DRAFT_764543 [Thozetella sp. PMI_491]